MSSENSETATADVPAYSGYRAPAVSIRATYTDGEVTDELVVDIDQGPVDAELIRAVIDALTERRNPTELEASVAGAQVYNLPRGPQSVFNATDRSEPVLTSDQRNTAGKEAQA
jgi:hypothetical protein